MSQSRQLAAIMFTDIVGYTAIMESDEVEGRKKAKRYRRVLEEQVQLHNGTVVQNYGDGSLSIFHSAVEAVNCGIKIQTKLRVEPQIPLRVGIHLGDIVIDGEELYGDGINVASRIESMGVAGAVLVSGSIYHEIKNQTDFRPISLGYFDFKNVKESMEVYALENEQLVVPKTGDLKGKFKEKSVLITPLVYLAVATIIILTSWGVWYNISDSSSATGKSKLESIAVLPLSDNTNTTDQAFLMEGLHKGLIDALGQLGGIKVISQASTVTYKDSVDKPDSEIALELGVDGVLRGQILQVEDSIKLDLQLIKSFPKERQIWSKEYARDSDEIMTLYSSIAMDVANEINLELSNAQVVRFSRPDQIKSETYNAYLRGMYFINGSTEEDFKKGMTYLQEAVSLDPANPLAYSGLAIGYAMLGHGPDPDDPVWKRAKAAAEQAIKLDSTIAEAHTVLALIKFYRELDWEGAEKAFLKALKINPNIALANFQYAWYLVAFGRFEEAIGYHQLAKELEPLTALYTSDLGSLYIWAGVDLDLALKEAEEGLELNPEFGHGWWVLGNIYVGKGNYEKAIEAHQKASSIHPIWKGALAGTYALAGNKIAATKMLKELKQQQMSPRVAFWQAYIHMTLGDFDSTFYWLEYQPPDPWQVTIRTWPEFKMLHSDPRFHEYIRKQGLPPI